MTWVFAVLAMGGVVLTVAGDPLLGMAMTLAGAGAMISPPTAPVPGRARTVSLALIAAASALAAADILISLLG